MSNDHKIKEIVAKLNVEVMNLLNETINKNLSMSSDDIRKIIYYFISLVSYSSLKGLYENVVDKRTTTLSDFIELTLTEIYEQNIETIKKIKNEIL